MTGWLALTLEQIADQMALPEAEQLCVFDTCKIIHLEKNHNTWWDLKQVQVQTIDAVNIFEYLQLPMENSPQRRSLFPMISLLLVWTHTRPIFALFSWLLTCCAKSCSFNQTFMTACAQSQHPKKLGHVSFHIKYLAAHAKVRHTFHYSM